MTPPTENNSGKQAEEFFDWSIRLFFGLLLYALGISIKNGLPVVFGSLLIISAIRKVLNK